MKSKTVVLAALGVLAGVFLLAYCQRADIAGRVMEVALDAQLGTFLDTLDERVGPARYMTARVTRDGKNVGRVEYVVAMAPAPTGETAGE